MSLRAVADRVAIHSTLVLRLAFSCSTRGKCAYVLSALRTPHSARSRKRHRSRLQPRTRSCLSRARLYTRQTLFRGSARLGLHHGRDTVIPHDNRRGGGDNASVTHGKYQRTHMANSRESSIFPHVAGYCFNAFFKRVRNSYSRNDFYFCY